MLKLSIGLGGVLNVLCTPALAESPPQALTTTELDLSYKPSFPGDSQPFTAGLAGYTVAVNNDSHLQFSPASCDQADACANDVADKPPSPALQRPKNTGIKRTLGNAQSSEFAPESSAAPALAEGWSMGDAIAQWPTESDPTFPPNADPPPETSETSDSSIRRNRAQAIGPTPTAEAQTAAGGDRANRLDADLGTLRVKPLQSRGDEELGVLRLLQTAQASPPKPAPPIAFLVARAGYFNSDNAFRSDPSLSEQISQTGLSLYIAPRLSERTSLYAIAETSLARYRNLPAVSYNTLEAQVGIRQRLFPRTYAQIGWRNQQLYSPGYKEKLFGVNAIDTLISHRIILNNQAWLDSFYQARLGFASPSLASRFRQTLTLSLNYGVTRNLRSSLIYQVDFDKYTQISRFDTSQQVLGVISYTVNDRSRISLFGGTRFGHSSEPEVDLSDTFYGAGLNISLPLF